MDTRQLLADEAKEYVNAIKAIDFKNFDDLQDLMKALPHVKLRDGYVLDAYYAGDMSFGAEMKLYAAKINSETQYYPVSRVVLNGFESYKEFLEWFGSPFKENEVVKKRLIRPFTDGQYIEGTVPWEASKTVPKLENYLELEYTPIAIWEALLLIEVTPLYLPHFWHAGGRRGMLVVDDNSLVKACTGRYTHGVNYKSLLGNQRMLLPMVEVKSSCLAYASYCYWNDWKGLSCVTFEVTNKERKICFNQIDEKILIEYNCRVMF